MIWDLLSLTGDLALLMWLVTALFWALAGAALASWLGRPLWRGAVLGAALPVLGVLIQLVRAGIRRGRAGGFRALAPARPAATWSGGATRVLSVALAALGAVALVVVTGLSDTLLRFGGRTRLSLAVRDVGLGTVTFVTVLVLVAAAAFCWWRPSRWAAVAAGWCASWWLLWSLAALLVGDTLRVLVESTGLGDATHAEFRVGLSWTLVLVLAVALLGWSAAVVAVADRRSAVAGAAPWPQQIGAPVDRSLPAPRRDQDPFALDGRAAPALPPVDPFAAPGTTYASPSDPFAARPPSAGRPGDPFSGGW